MRRRQPHTPPLLYKGHVMLKVIMLRIAAFILIVAGELVVLFGCAYAHSSLVGVFELLGCVAALIACFLLAIYCCWAADDIDEKSNIPTFERSHDG